MSLSRNTTASWLMPCPRCFLPSLRTHVLPGGLSAMPYHACGLPSRRVSAVLAGTVSETVSALKPSRMTFKCAPLQQCASIFILVSLSLELQHPDCRAKHLPWRRRHRKCHALRGCSSLIIPFSLDVPSNPNALVVCSKPRSVLVCSSWECETSIGAPQRNFVPAAST